jgi:hypothetical protein
MESVTLFRNDEVIWQQDYLTATGPDTGDEGAFLLSFGSDATPFHPGDNPRGWRHWRGSIEVQDGTLESAQGMDFHNSFFQSLTRDPVQPNRFEFATLTRGDTSSIALRLSGVKRTTALSITLEDTRETGGAPPVYRKPQLAKGGQINLVLRDLNRGRLERTLTVDSYTDTVLLRRQIDDGDREVRFEVTDRSKKQGDYYFIRVRQANDAMAWSSPIWIGGFPKR